MKKIGILGGISYTSTVQYYRRLHELFYEKTHHYYYPEMVIESLNFQYFTDLEDQNRRDEYRQYILQGLNNLQKAGADLAIMAANSPHSVYEDILPDAPLPLLSIVDAVGRHARSQGYLKLLLTGIGYTMRSSFYAEGLKKYGIEVVVPNEADQQWIDHLIFSELVLDQIHPSSREAFLKRIAPYNTDAVILGCTELPLLVQPSDTEIPLINSLEVHCMEVLQHVLQDESA